MKRLLPILVRWEIQVLICIACLCLFSWPLLTGMGMSTLGEMVMTIFLAWASVVIVLFFMGRAARVMHQQENKR